MLAKDGDVGSYSSDTVDSVGDPVVYDGTWTSEPPRMLVIEESILETWERDVGNMLAKDGDVGSYSSDTVDSVGDPVAYDGTWTSEPPRMLVMVGQATAYLLAPTALSGRLSGLYQRVSCKGPCQGALAVCSYSFPKVPATVRSSLAS